MPLLPVLLQLFANGKCGSFMRLTAFTILPLLLSVLLPFPLAAFC
jgi:hypothetical protein